MAQGSDEHRMVFDIRGRRRHVVKVVYAILAVLMGLSLFLVTGAINIGSILGTNSSGESATSSFEQQAERIEAKLAKTPEDEDLLANLTRTRINIANAMITNGAGESQGGVEEVEAAAGPGERRLVEIPEGRRRTEPGPGDPGRAGAVPAGRILVQRRRGPGKREGGDGSAGNRRRRRARASTASARSRSTRLFAQDYKAAKQKREEATKLANTKFERERSKTNTKKSKKTPKNSAKA